MNIAVIVLVSVAAVCMAAPPIKEECKNFPKSNPKDCCAMPKFVDEGTRKCFKDNKDKPENIPACVFKDATVIKDNEIDRAALIAALETKLATADAGFNKALHEKVADKCIARSKEHKGDEEKAKKPGQLFGLLFCLKNEYFKNCPASAWTVSDSCTAWKKYAEECPIMFGRRGRHDDKPESL